MKNYSTSLLNFSTHYIATVVKWYNWALPLQVFNNTYAVDLPGPGFSPGGRIISQVK